MVRHTVSRVLESMESTTYGSPSSTEKLPGWSQDFKCAPDEMLGCQSTVPTPASVGDKPDNVYKVAVPSPSPEPTGGVDEENHVFLSEISLDDAATPNTSSCSSTAFFTPVVPLGEPNERAECLLVHDGHTIVKAERPEAREGQADKRLTFVSGRRLRRPWDPPTFQPDGSTLSSIQGIDPLDNSMPPIPVYTSTLYQPPACMESAESPVSTWSESSPSPPGSDSSISGLSSLKMPFKSHPTAQQDTSGRTPGASANSSGRGICMSEQNHEPPMRPPKRANPVSDSFDEDDSSSRKARRKELDRPFACPMYKRDPILHSQCAAFRLTRIKDVKQHIWRAHYRPYCPRCYLTFSSESLRDQHARERPPCESVDEVPQNWGNITGEQRSGLVPRFDRRGTAEEHWFRIWDILFPEVDRPQSPYLFSPVEETISRVRHFWEREQRPIISAVLNNRRDPWTATPEGVAEIVSEVLARFQECQLAAASQDHWSPEHGNSPVHPSCFPDVQGMGVLDSDLTGLFDFLDVPLAERLDTLDSGLGGQFEAEEMWQGFSNP